MNIVVIVLMSVWFFALGSAFGELLKERKLNKKILSKENVIACFKDVDWNVYTFSSGGTAMKTADGVEHFYKVPPIKNAIDKLNSLMDSSPANNACTGQVAGAGKSDGESTSAVSCQ